MVSGYHRGKYVGFGALWQQIHGCPVSSFHFGANFVNSYVKQESSVKLTNQRVSYAFTSSPFSFHACHILPASKFGIVILVFYLFPTGISEQHV